jgi:hypothetical protein
MTNKEAGEKWRLAQAKRLIDLFEQDMGHSPTMKELEGWHESRRGRAILAANEDKNGKIIVR